MAYRDGELTGVGGWLAVFLATLGVLNPAIVLYGLWQVMSYQAPSPGVADHLASLQSFEIAITAVKLLCYWSLVWRFLAVRTWRTVQIGIAAIWIITLGLQAVEIAGIASTSGVPVETLLANLGPNLARPVIYCGIWTAYLLKSVRVENTYYRYDDESGLSDVFE